MTPYWFIQGDFLRTRSSRIGASDVPALLPNPEKPTESLAGRWRQPDGSYYNRTAVTVWEEKTGRKKSPPAGLPAEMGHWNEPKAIELFMRPIFGAEVAEDWLMKRMQYEILKPRHPDLDPRMYQDGPIKHHAQWCNEDFITHPDGVYDGEPKAETIKAHGQTIDLSRPFLVEGKSARFWSANRPAGSLVSGYDPDLTTWQGIPLKNYIQIQFQLALFDVEVCYLPLLYDTSSFHVWQITANHDWQNKLIDLAGRMAWHIRNDKPPKELAINTDDIKSLYPDVLEDFAYLAGDELDKAVEYARKARHAAEQKKLWTAREADARDALAPILRDRKEIHGPDYGKIAQWIEKGGYESLSMPVKQLEQEDANAYRYLKRKKLLKEVRGSRYLNVTLREE